MEEAELGRAWLKYCFEEQRPKAGMGAKRIPWRTEALDLLDITPPMYWCGQRQTGDYSYVDLIAAYPSIYSTLALDVRFQPWRSTPRLTVGRIKFLEAKDMLRFKAAQRSIGGILRSRRITTYIGGQACVADSTGWSTFLAPDLWGVLMYALHGAAIMALEHGAVMIYTDGYIVPTERAESLISSLGCRYGLSASVRGQVRDIWGMHDYSKKEVGKQTVQRPLSYLLDRSILPACDLIAATRASA